MAERDEAAAPVPPDPRPVNASWTAVAEPGPGVGGWLGRLLLKLLASQLEAQRAFNADQVRLDNALLQYLDERFGGLATEDPAFWEVYATGLDELYREMPYLDGVLIRIGEAGQVYDLPEWDYRSELAVTTVDAVRAMLTTLLDQAERAERELVFRTWSVGVGAVGDMHTNPGKGSPRVPFEFVKGNTFYGGGSRSPSSPSALKGFISFTQTFNHRRQRGAVNQLHHVVRIAPFFTK